MRIKNEAGKNTLDWFEELYSFANKDEYWIPWSNGKPHPFLEEYMSIIQNKGKALVVGCGLGEDAVYLSQMGWKVTAFDISPSAIQWAKEKYNHTNINWEVADLLSLGTDWNNYFDLVVEIHILQAIPESLRILAAPNLSPLLAPYGKLICIGRLNEIDEEFEGPPWPLHKDFIDSIGIGLNNIDFKINNLPNDDSDVMRYRAVWHNNN